MINFTGSTCIICQQKFQEGDDIVVCPECGTPYHRACYAKENRCVNTALHESGKSWQDERREAQREEAEAKADEILRQGPQQAMQNSEEPRVYIRSPNGENVYFDANDPCCGMSPDESMESEKLGDVAGFVQKNTLYYIPLFRLFRDMGRKVSMNFSCLLFPHFYFAYRKMWMMSILSMLMLLVCDIPGVLLNFLAVLTDESYISSINEFYGMDLSGQFTGIIAFLEGKEALLNSLVVPMYLLQITLRTVLCMFGNYLYYRFVLKSVGRLRETSPNPHVFQNRLLVSGGVNIWNVVGCVALNGVLQFLELYILIVVCQM